MFGLKPKANEKLSDERLMQLICLGDRLAFELIYNRYFAKLCGFCKRLLFDNEMQAEDIVQEVFMKIIQKPELFNNDKVFSTWIYTLARNLCYNHTRNENNRKNLAVENFQLQDKAFLHPTNDVNLIKSRISAFYKELSEKEKMLFVLRFEHHKSIKEIADIANIPEGSVKSGIYYLLKKVAIQLKDIKDEFN